MKAIDLSKQQAHNGDPKATHQINFTRNLGQQGTMLFVIKEAKITIFNFSQGILRIL